MLLPALTVSGTASIALFNKTSSWVLVLNHTYIHTYTHTRLRYKGFTLRCGRSTGLHFIRYVIAHLISHRYRIQSPYRPCPHASIGRQKLRQLPTTWPYIDTVRAAAAATVQSDLHILTSYISNFLFHCPRSEALWWNRSIWNVPLDVQHFLALSRTATLCVQGSYNDTMRFQYKVNAIHAENIPRYGISHD